VNKKAKRRLPYVGDDPVTGRAYLEIPTQFKPVEHACCVCEKPYAPFGVGYPENTKWFCREHVGEVMPEVQDNDARAKLNEVRRKSVKGARLWLDLYVACSNGDVDGARGIWKHIRDVSVEASDILKGIGTGGGETPNG
jgi:hypothetical protein